MKNNKFTYQKSGVNISEADKFVKFISQNTGKKKEKNKNIGGFGSISNIPKYFKEPKIVASTDGVGTKVEIANSLNKFNTIGIDLVAMCVNDLIVQGARPLIFLDYISINKINLKKLKSLLVGINKGCNISNCTLVGGETAEMPGTYSKNKFDIAGFAVGIVDKKKIVKKNKIKKNDLILAVPASGIHSNGFSLIRYILKTKKINLKRNKYLKKELIKPTKIYVKEILKLFQLNLIKSCANITGGGLEDNIKRVMPEGLTASIDLSKIKPNKIFSWIKTQNVSDDEMLKTFNCGVGFCLIAKSNNIIKIQKLFNRKFKPYVIGKIVTGRTKIKFYEKVQW